MGSEIAKYCKTLGMKATGVNTSGNYQSENTVFDKIYNVNEMHNHNINENFDYVINTMPLTLSTKNFFCENLLSQLGNGYMFINLGRGKSVVESDLIHLLKNKTIRFAALDVFEEEPLSKNSELWNMKNVLITPHISGIIPKFKTKSYEMFLKNLRLFIANDKLNNVVSLDKGY